MHPFLAYIRTFVDLPLAEWQQIERCLQREELPAENLILEQGNICRNLYFLEEGLVRFFVWKDGNDITKFFTQPPYCFTSQKSLTKQIPAKENIATIEKSIIWKMNERDAFGLLKLPSWSDFIRLLIQEVQDNTEEIMEALQQETAEERYSKMLIEEPELIRRVPLKYLSSYLGIAPQSLSRIRRKLSRA